MGYKIDDSDKDYKIYHREILYAKKSSEYFMILWYVFVIAAISQWCLTPLTSDFYNNKDIDKNNENISLSRSYPNGATIPIEIDTLTKYLLIFLYQSLGILFSAIGMSSCDILLVSLMMYICAHLKYLNSRLIDENNIQSILRSKNPSEKLKEKLKNCVIYHDQILKVHENYLSYSNGAMFAQCIQNIIALCLVSLQASTMHYSPGIDFIVAFTSMIEYSMGISFELFAFCYYGTKLEELGHEVSDSFFFSNWDKLKIDKKCQDIQDKIQNIIKLGIMRAQKPIIITGEYKIYHQEMLDAKKASEYFMIVWFPFTILGVVQWCLTPLTSDFYINKDIDRNNKNMTLLRSYPNGATFPIEIDTLTKYLLMFLFQSLGILFSAIGMSGCDVILISIIMYICAHLRYLNNCLIDENNIQLILKSKNPSEKLKEKLKNCVIFHDQILKVHENYLSYSNGAMFAQCIENIISLCLVSLQASTMHYSPGIDFIVAFTSMIEYSMGIFIELFAFCYYGTKLEELGHEVSDSFFSSNWEKCNDKIQIKIQNILKLGIMRSQKPIIITGGPFYIFNLETFKKLAYMSISNSVVLRQLQTTD
ncbi:hypothetical protein HCN44_001252 [Aphidius gifuensis]|uniref:Odorant receptor n=1 Tax=Aphidius gifuensis TaxID=684658 RepID=A0A835CLD9_APHGI|nr:hypothetical protein HCN44_001252 [Aphidius gifuensis]